MLTLLKLLFLNNYNINVPNGAFVNYMTHEYNTKNISNTHNISIDNWLYYNIKDRLDNSFYYIEEICKENYPVKLDNNTNYKTMIIEIEENTETKVLNILSNKTDIYTIQNIKYRHFSNLFNYIESESNGIIQNVWKFIYNSNIANNDIERIYEYTFQREFIRYINKLSNSDNTGMNIVMNTEIITKRDEICNSIINNIYSIPVNNTYNFLDILIKGIDLNLNKYLHNEDKYSKYNFKNINDRELNILKLNIGKSLLKIIKYHIFDKKTLNEIYSSFGIINLNKNWQLWESNINNLKNIYTFYKIIENSDTYKEMQCKNKIHKIVKLYSEDSSIIENKIKENTSWLDYKTIFIIILVIIIRISKF